MNIEEIRSMQSNPLGCKVVADKTMLGGVSTPVLNAMVVMNKNEFHNDYKGPHGLRTLEEQYKSLSFHCSDCVFPFYQAFGDKEYGVFSFYVSDDWKGLNQLDTPLSSDLALDIFRNLIKLLIKYSNSAVNAKTYNPLLFICLESVYVRLNDEGLVQDMKLLPLPYKTDCEYIGMPRDAYMTKSDVSVDIFMAAYLYLSLKYPNNEPFKEDDYSDYDSLAECCLSLFAQRRPSLDKLAEALDIDCDSDGSFIKKEKTPPVMPVKEEYDEDDVYDYDYEDESKPKKPGALTKILEQGKKGLKKGAKSITGAISDVKGKLDNMLSTERGDSTEEEED